MDVLKVTIHEVSKDAKTKNASIFIPEEILDSSNPKVLKLIELLNNTFGRDRIFNALFLNGEHVFPSNFKEYISSSNSDSDFKLFTNNITKHLKVEIEKAFLAKGGYLVHADYINNSTHFIASFLVRDIDGISFSKNSGVFSINEIRHINVKNLAMACRINVNKYNNETGKYIGFIKGDNQEKISDYFLDWVSIYQPESSTDYTQKLYNIVNKIHLPIDPSSGTTIDRDTFRRRVVDIINANNNIVDIRMLSIGLYSEPNVISDYLNTNDIELDSDFKADKRVLRKFRSIEVKKDNITLKFVKGDLSGKVKLSEENPNQIIIESEAFASEFRKQIAD